MFGNNGRIIHELTRENENLKQENERLQRLQPGGLALAYGQAFDARVHDLVSRDYDPMQLDTGVPVIGGMDVIFDNAMKHAAEEVAPEALTKLNEDQQVELATRLLGPATLEEVAYKGLTRAITGKPELVKRFLSEDDVRSFIDKLVSDEDERELIVGKLISKELDVKDLNALKEELERFGHFSTDCLSEGAQINVELSTPISYLELGGRVVKTKDQSHWIDVTSVEGNGRLLNFVKVHDLIRLGHKNGEDDIVAQVIPESITGVISKKYHTTILGYNMEYILDTFRIDDTDVF
jgi:hypothetical protein